MALTFSDTKGAPLTAAEADQNIRELRDRANHTGSQAISTVSGLQGALDSKAELIGAPVVVVAGATYTLALTDAGKLIEFTSSSAVTVTIPAQSSVTFSGAEEYHLCQAGSGKVSVTTAGGVTLVKPATLNAATREANSVCTLKRRAIDSWRLFGDLEAST